jgi:hypothetical protein
MAADRVVATGGRTSTRRLTDASNPPTLHTTSNCPQCSPRLIWLAISYNPASAGGIERFTSALAGAFDPRKLYRPHHT